MYYSSFAIITHDLHCSVLKASFWDIKWIKTNLHTMSLKPPSVPYSGILEGPITVNLEALPPYNLL